LTTLSRVNYLWLHVDLKATDATKAPRDCSLPLVADFMTVLHSSLYAAALVSCLLLLLAIQGAPPDRRKRARYLFVLLSLLTLNFACEWMMSNPASPAKSLWLSMVMGIALLLGPSLWMYARGVANPEAVSKLSELPRWHWLPIAAGFSFLLPLVGKIHLGTDFVHPGTVLPVRQPTLVHVTMLAAILIFTVQAAFYLFLTRRVLATQAKAAKALLSTLEDRELNTLRLMVWLVGAHWVFGIARTLHCLLLGKDAGYGVLFAVGEVMFTLWAAISLMRAGFSPSAGDRRLAEEMGDAKYARSGLDAPARQRILRKLTEAWNVGRAHLNSQLTLRSLCTQIRENPHYVSQVINQDLGTSFYDLVNQHRIAAAKEALLRTPDRTVLEIALEVGFNSKSTFNAAFRQFVGSTPTEFRRDRPGEGISPTSEPAG
jgi:AraC-like DNA-binding protein